MKSPAADLLDTAALLGDVGGRVASVHGDGGARVSVEIGEGAREGGSGGGEWTRRVPGVSPDESRRRGRARGVGCVVDMLSQLGGIPPSSLEARGEEDDRGGAAGPSGGPRPGRQVGFLYFFVCLIFPFLFLFL